MGTRTAGPDVAETAGRLRRHRELRAPARVIDRPAVVSGLPSLAERQRGVLRLRFEEDLEQTEIAGRPGRWQTRVSRLPQSGLQRLATVAAHESDG